MKGKFPKFLLIFILLFVFVFIGSGVYEFKFAATEKPWLLYESLSNVLSYLPVLAALSILWALVFKDKEEEQGFGQSGSQVKGSSLMMSFLLFTLFNFVFAFLISELALPKLYEYSQIKSVLAEEELKSLPELTGAESDEIFVSDFTKLKNYPHKDDVSFARGTVIFYFESFYKAGSDYYIKGLTVYGYTNSVLDYIITADYARVEDDVILAKDAVFLDYLSGKFNKKTTYSGQTKEVPIVFDTSAVYSLSCVEEVRDISLIDVFWHNDFIYFSKVNHFRLGNLVYTKIAYYIILILMIMISVSVGQSSENLRVVTKEIFQTVSFYIASVIITCAAYDLLVEFANMLYSLVV